MRDINEIINNIDKILMNEQGDTLDQLGSYIVGVTIVQDDYEELQKNYPLLESIAELGAELETQGNTPYAKEVHRQIIKSLHRLKTDLS